MSKRSFTLRGMAIGLAMLMFACSEDFENNMRPSDVVQNVPNDMAADADVVSFSNQSVPNQYIVVFNKEKTGYAGARFSGPKQASEHVKKQALSIVRSVAPAFSEDQFLAVYHSINGAAIKLSDDKVEALRKDERVAYVEQDRIITLARPGSGGDGGSGDIIPYGVKRVTGSETGIDCSSEEETSVAWVIDTGIDLDHPDLKVDTKRSVTFVDFGKDAKTADDFNGHGTHVAGTIAAEIDGSGVVGVAAGAPVVAVKVLDQRGSGYYSDVIEGVLHVGANGKAGDVANMSLGGPHSQALNDAVITASTGNGRNVNIYFTLAAGNDNKEASSYSPASAEGTNIYTISAIDEANNFAYFSNYGDIDGKYVENGEEKSFSLIGSLPPIDYCAPGVKVYSTYKDGTYKTLSGTSMAAPHAAGVLLLQSIHGGMVSSGGLANLNGYDMDGEKDPIIVFQK